MNVAEGSRWVSAQIMVGLASGVLAGLSSALFLFLLELATSAHRDHPNLIWLLPATGVLIAWIYAAAGKNSDAGTDLILDHLHDQSKMVPTRIAPIILLTTILTHFAGGSAGREGTAIQMGGGLAAGLSRRFGLEDRITIAATIAGIAGGFAAVFGTPIAGAIFGIEVIHHYRFKWHALLACTIAAFVGDFTCRATGIQHFPFPRLAIMPADSRIIGLLILLAIASGLAALVFIEATHFLKSCAARLPAARWIAPVAGGTLLIALTLAVGTRDYNGLSLPLLERTFQGGTVDHVAFLLKIVFTAITISFGFKGGEVTPLFVIGATLGATIAQMAGVNPLPFAAIGLAAVFAAAAHTPVACIALGCELFGPSLAVPLTFCCLCACVVTHHRGIYGSQRVTLKGHAEPTTLAQHRAKSSKLRKVERNAVK